MLYNKSGERMIKCIVCKKPINADDLGAITKDGLLHKLCCFKVIYIDHKTNFITGYELKVKE